MSLFAKPPTLTFEIWNSWLLICLGYRFADRDPACCQQPRLLAHGQNPGTTARIVQRVVEMPRLGQHQRLLDQGSGLRYRSRPGDIERADLLNRPLRTRMVGGVGAGSLKLLSTRLGGNFAHAPS